MIEQALNFVPTLIFVIALGYVLCCFLWFLLKFKFKKAAISAIAIVVQVIHFMIVSMYSSILVGKLNEVNVSNIVVFVLVSSTFSLLIMCVVYRLLEKYK